MNRIENAHIVLADEIMHGMMVTEQGRISDLAEAARMSAVTATEDWEGDYLLPGMVELHTDNLEKHLMPRPKVRWPTLPAILAHDVQVAASGITTVLDAISVGDIDTDSMRNDTLQACTEGLRLAADAGILRADHFLHMRLELAEENLLDMFAPYLNDDRLKLVSLMDHTPGQRQWTDLSHYRTYVSGKRGWSEDKVESMLEHLFIRQQAYAASNRRSIVSSCRALDNPVPLATHDDTTVEHVAEGVDDGVTISEFPTTVAAAKAAREQGLGIIMGAPNVVRGGSHSGNVSAAELARLDLLDVLSSDYVPASLLHAAFLLQDEGFSLPKAVATVTRNPARMIGLHDRGEIAVGLRADYLRVRVVQGIPVVMGVWKAGRQIA
ncbi:alpha-D-ribose 1-methylphosphonate 5-triphosphate diphosphatase [Undibacterium sp. CY18W]|uniref:Alpha-D-ribose 1-methylphosphonate 5-triphosphate diphosphatase n=1 Tax=Undibacterium hunanense TaxID=2762292 RepID=A0ABR6ZMB5_9BURK|nr:alpha-D-ribose 1-methylphosphonate 5-triphosphate diphosphatase [Undibacterium hunanense]MBC3917051.1 alpha-D-ribose 1-methylphosphonate 5-triphosphate diphosphatase [Undibacterium hunanense]